MKVIFIGDIHGRGQWKSILQKEGRSDVWESQFIQHLTPVSVGAEVGKDLFSDFWGIFRYELHQVVVKVDHEVAVGAAQNGVFDQRRTNIIVVVGR